MGGGGAQSLELAAVSRGGVLELGAARLPLKDVTQRLDSLGSLSVFAGLNDAKRNASLLWRANTEHAGRDATEEFSKDGSNREDGGERGDEGEWFARALVVKEAKALEGSQVELCVALCDLRRQS